jgi:hypothetical protein
LCWKGCGVEEAIAELEVPLSTFYDWYRRYAEAGYGGLADRQPQRQQFWNRISNYVREQVVDVAFMKGTRIGLVVYSRAPFHASSVNLSPPPNAYVATATANMESAAYSPPVSW